MDYFENLKHKNYLPWLIIVLIGIIMLFYHLWQQNEAQVNSLPPAELTEAERDWLDQNPDKLVLYFNIEFPPIEFSADNETFTGIGADIIAKVEEILNVQFIKAPSDDWNEHLAALKSGECAVAPTIVKTSDREEYAFFTTPYASAPVVIITKDSITDTLRIENLDGWKIAVVTGYATEKYLNDQALLIDIEVIPVFNVSEGLRQVAFGQVDAFVENIAVAAYYIDQMNIPNLRVAGETDYAFDWSIGISREYPLLYSSIQKALDAISDEELEAIRGKWITLTVEPGLTPQARNLIWLSGLFMSLLLSGLIVITYFLKKNLNKTVDSLLESENKFRSFVEHSNDIIFTLNEEGYFTYVSPSWKVTLGHDENEVLGKTFTEFIHKDDIERCLEFQMRILEEKVQKESLEYRVRHKDGSLKWHEANGSLVEKDGQYYYIGVARNITESKLVEEKIRYMSFHDHLTDLYNRYFIEEEMNRLNTKRQLPISIIMADVNGLKIINDTYGHDKGDLLLKTVANIIVSSCREEDIISRWGGDEFVILLPQTATDEARNICRRIVLKCEESYIDDLPVSIAIGVATKTDHSVSMIAALREAEDNMYKKKLTESRSTKSAVVQALLKTLSEKSFETEAHTRGMQKIARKIGERLKLTDSDMSRLDLLIILHDIGKINLSQHLLTKPEPLEDEERAEIRKHPETGFRIARATEDFAHVADEILSHHERWDGKGYPRGLEGKDIPLLSRIAAVADAYEVMANGRPYKPAMKSDDILYEFEINAGKQFDPEIVAIIISLIKRSEL